MQAGITLAPPMGMLRKSVLILVLGLGACRRNPEDNATSLPAPPPAAALAARGRSLDASLLELEKELSSALGSGMDDDGKGHIMLAEAITDRLLETRMPFLWLKATSYSLESYVRQIQALADRVVAEMRSGVDKGAVARDVTELRHRVISLRTALRAGGSKMPVSLDSLLAGTPADTVLPTDAGE